MTMNGEIFILVDVESSEGSPGNETSIRKWAARYGIEITAEGEDESFIHGEYDLRIRVKSIPDAIERVKATEDDNAAMLKLKGDFIGVIVPLEGTTNQMLYPSIHKED